MRTIVVGASSGLGRCIGRGLARRGARVALLARRRGHLEEAAREAGPGTLVVECDVTDETACRGAIAEAAAGLGGIDAVVYATGIGPLSRGSRISTPRRGATHSTPTWWVRRSSRAWRCPTCASRVARPCTSRR